MKCIYCNREADLSISDIIPAALTGAKLKKRFVCKEHNGFTNDNYEKIMISNLAIYRNLLGLTERDGDPVRFVADLEIDGYIFKDTKISDKSSILNGSRSFSQTDVDGRKVIVGKRENLLKINGATAEKIKDINLGNVSISTTDDIRELFISSPVLHAIAKIAYEWHCFEHGIENYIQEKYKGIVSYILSPEDTSPLVEVVIDERILNIMDIYSRNGSNTIFEYNDEDGRTYVVFGLWNVIYYKVQICCSDTTNSPTSNVYKVSSFHADGSKDESPIGVWGVLRVKAVSPPTGLSIMCAVIKDRLSKIGERDLSREYLKNSVEQIKKLLPRYKSGKCSLSELLDFEAQDRVIPVYILELLLIHQNEYDPTKSFNQNMIHILETKDHYVITNEKKAEILQRYLGMDQSGKFASMLENAISFFEAVCMS